jgi:hypothetical protein
VPAVKPSFPPLRLQARPEWPLAEAAPPLEAFDQLHALLDASALLGRVLDTLTHALAGRQAVPPAAQALLARLFPAAASISATLPSPDGLALAVTTLLHPACSLCEAGHAAATQHVEPLGRGVCCFQLAAPPPPAARRLMRAFLDRLAARLNLEAAEDAAAAASPERQRRVRAGRLRLQPRRRGLPPRC